jgi:hypothetical protein
MNVIPPIHHACVYLQSTMFSRYRQMIYNVIFVPDTYSIAKEQNLLALKRKEGKGWKKLAFHLWSQTSKIFI